MHDNWRAAYTTVSCRTGESSDITRGVIWVGLSLPRENSNIIGAHFASLSLCLLAIITICYRTYQKKTTWVLSQVLSHNPFCFCFSGLVSRCLYSTGGSAKWAFSLTVTSICQAASIWIQYSLKSCVLGLINRSVGAAFDQEMGLDRGGSQPVVLASHCLSTKFKQRSPQ